MKRTLLTVVFALLLSLTALGHALASEKPLTLGDCNITVNGAPRTVRAITNHEARLTAAGGYHYVIVRVRVEKTSGKSLLWSSDELWAEVLLADQPKEALPPRARCAAFRILGESPDTEGAMWVLPREAGKSFGWEHFKTNKAAIAYAELAFHVPSNTTGIRLLVLRAVGEVTLATPNAADKTEAPPSGASRSAPAGNTRDA